MLDKPFAVQYFGNDFHFLIVPIGLSAFLLGVIFLSSLKVVHKYLLDAHTVCGNLEKLCQFDCFTFSPKANLINFGELS